MRPRFLLFLLLAASASAQTPSSADTTAAPELGRVTVTATRAAMDTHDAPSRVTVISREALDASGSQSVADALEARSPLFVRRYGPSGLATVTTRGATASQTMVLLDGQRLTDPQLGQVDLSLLPTALLESVELLHGAASGLYGSDAMGGVVHMRTPGVGAPARIGAEAGAWGRRRVHALAGGSAGPFRALVATETTSSTDDYRFTDRTRIGKPLVQRQGWDGRQASAYAALTASGRAGQLTGSLWAADAERGLGGTGAVGERQWDRLVRIGLSGLTPMSWGRIEGSSNVQVKRLRYANPFPAPADRPDAIDDTGRTRTLNVEARAVLGSSALNETTISVSGGEGRAEHPSLTASAVDRFGALGLASARTFGRVALFPTLRADLYAPSGGEQRLAVTPHIGTNVRLDQAGALRAKASAGRSFRMPTLNDRFWLPGGNPNLRPERGWSADAGLSWQKTDVRAEATVFAARASDQIVWSPTAAGFWAPGNVARTASVGAEVSAEAERRVRLGGHAARITAGGTGTVLQSRELDANQPLRYVPGWTARGWSGLAIGPLRVDIGAQATGRRYTTASASQALPAYIVASAHVRYARAVGPTTVTLGLAAENLLDARYEVVRSYVMPPRSARLSISISPR